MTPKFKPNILSVAIVATLFSSYVHAEDDGKLKKQTDKEVEIEVIEVTGLKSSLRKALNAKRFADTVSDSIHAEDVGKSTDQNIADALSRITGVTVQEEDGEGTRISVRGAGPSLNQISMNGVALTSGMNGDGADQSVDLSAFSADILSSIDVVKSAAANQDEGSLGASINLTTVQPLALKNDRRSFEYQGRHNDYSGKYDRKISGSVSQKFLDESLGFVLTVSDETQGSRRDELKHDYRTDPSFLEDANASDTNGKRIRIVGHDESIADLNLKYQGNPELQWNDQTDVLYQGGFGYSALNQTDFSLDLNQRKRRSASLGIQFLPTDTTDIQLDLTYSQLEIQKDKQSVRVQYKPEAATLPSDPNTQWRIIDAERHFLVSDIGRRTTGVLARDLGGNEIETNVASLRVTQEITSDLILNLTAGYSYTSDDSIEGYSLNTATWNTVAPGDVNNLDLDQIEPVGYDCRTGINCDIRVGTSGYQYDPVYNEFVYASSRFNPLDLSSNHLGGLSTRSHRNEDTNKSLFLDFEYAIDLWGFTSIEFGGKYSNRLKDVNSSNISVVSGINAAVDDDTGEPIDLNGAALETIRLVDVMEANSAFPVNDFMDGVYSNSNLSFLNGWAQLSPDKAYAEVFGKSPGTTSLREDPSGSRKIEDDTKAIYAKFNFAYMDGRLTGNVGLRYVQTKIDAEGYVSVRYPTSTQHINPYDLVYKQQVANMSLPICDEPNYGTPRNLNNPVQNYNYELAEGVTEGHAGIDYSQNEKCFDRHLTHEYQTNDAATFPEINEYNGRNYLAGWSPDVFDGSPNAWENKATELQNMQNVLFAYNYSDPNNPTLIKNEYLLDHFPTYRTRLARGKPSMRPWLDRSTTQFNASGVLGNSASLRNSISTDTSDYSLLLPSLTLNYAISDELIARFAASKTNTPPKFDSLAPKRAISSSLIA